MRTSKLVRMFSVMMALFMCLMVTMPVVAYGTANTDTDTVTNTEPVTLDDPTEVFSLDNNSKAIIVLSIAVLLPGFGVFLWGISIVLKSISNFIIEFLKCLPLITDTIFKVIDKLSSFVKNIKIPLKNTLKLVDRYIEAMFSPLYLINLCIAGIVLTISIILLFLYTVCMKYGHVIISVLLLLFGLILLYASDHFATKALKHLNNEITTP